MNTGIGDAVNLSWKLAGVLQGRVHERVLETYESERIGFARRLVATTDRVFTIATGSGALAAQARLTLAPRLLPALTAAAAVRRLMFKTVSQTGIDYRKSPLSRGGAGRVMGGDRLPWAGAGSGPAGGDNFTPLASLDWQVHVYGEASQAVRDVCTARALALREFLWRDEFWRVGLMQDALYLVRPDGHVALADPNGRPAALERFLDAWAIEPRPNPPARATRKPAAKRPPRARKLSQAGAAAITGPSK